MSGLAQTKRQTVANLIVFLDHTGVGVNYSNIFKKSFFFSKVGTLLTYNSVKNFFDNNFVLKNPFWKTRHKELGSILVC